MYCDKCNKYYSDDIMFCVSCGNKLIVKEKEDAFLQFTNLNNDIEKRNIVSNERIIAIFSYFNVLILIPLLSSKRKQSDFIQYHFRQGVGLIVYIIAVSIVLGIYNLVGRNIIMYMLYNSMTYLAYFISISYNIIRFSLNISIYFFVITGIMNVIHYKMKPLALIGRF